MEKVLVFENENRHVKAFYEFAESAVNTMSVKFIVETDYQEAIRKIRSDKIDGALLDIFAPVPAEAKVTRIKSISLLNDFVKEIDIKKVIDHYDYRSHLQNFHLFLDSISSGTSKEAPVGLLIAEEAEKLEIPFVMVSDLFHHSKKLNLIYYFLSRINEKVKNRRCSLYDGWKRDYYVHDDMRKVIDKPERNKDNPAFWSKAFQELKDLFQEQNQLG